MFIIDKVFYDKNGIIITLWVYIFSYEMDDHYLKVKYL